MSEEILKALMQLFAIISKQDTGANVSHRLFVELFLKNQLSKNKVTEYLELYDSFLVEKESKRKEELPSEETEKPKLTSVLDSVKTLAICKKINKTLVQKQKAVVFIRLLELLKSRNEFTPQRLAIIDTVSTVFNISEEERKLMSHFIVSDDPYSQENEDLLVIDDKQIVTLNYITGTHHLHAHGLDGNISVAKIQSVNLYFLRYNGDSEVFLNGLPIQQNTIYILAPGSTLRMPRGTSYYSEIANTFVTKTDYTQLTFQCKELEFTFPNGKVALNNINLEEKSGTLVSIMGASGAGKTTLLNVLCGLEKPSKGAVLINGKNIFNDKKDVEGLVGYISQDDLLFEELSVYKNLYYNAELCFKDKSPEQLEKQVSQTLYSLGLYEIRDVIVGSPLNKKISGGQRKRLNIALELIREPAILFVDEPTSGLSSRDSENVMDLLKELSQRGKLIFVVIHQPSSDIYKMFDKLFLLDVGGLPIYYGNPVEGVMYFKKITNQLNSDIGECDSCGNVNPELIFNLIESKEVDEYGENTENRKYLPADWNELYLKNTIVTFQEKAFSTIEILSSIPKRAKQFAVFTKRDVFSKLANTQYILINLLEAPLLAFILSFIIRYTAKTKDAKYMFRDNDNIPAYIFMSIIVMLFIGLTVSAEEIFKDRKILKRERFLNLSPMAYFLSKIVILFTISAIQSLLFTVVGNSIIELKGMYFSFWLMLFTVSCCSNLIGLNISNAFNSAVTIYIIIPLLIIPQMILGGAMFTFDKLNSYIGGGTGVPPIASVMPSRWGYEGLMVEQFRNNNYEQPFFELDKKISQLNNKMTYYIPELTQVNTDALKLFGKGTDEEHVALREKLSILQLELNNEAKLNPTVVMKGLNDIDQFNYTPDTYELINLHFSRLNTLYNQQFNELDKERNLQVSSFVDSPEGQERFLRIKNSYSNEYLEDVIKKGYIKNKYILEDGRLVQQIDAIFIDPPKQYISTKTHFFTPYKYLFGTQVSTFVFNILVIWMVSVILFITLYFELLKKLLNSLTKSSSF